MEKHLCNPKSVKMGQLYGQFDEVSHEWTDGILATLIRTTSRDPSPIHKRYVFFLFGGCYFLAVLLWVVVC